MLTIGKLIPRDFFCLFTEHIIETEEWFFIVVFVVWGVFWVMCLHP